MASNLIFITGATGFIGSQTVNAALAAGYRVRLAIRRKEQEHDIRRWAVGSKDSLEFRHVPDLQKASSFKGLLDDVDFIFHLASPMPGKGDDLKKDYVQPAVAGTTAILEAALESKTLKFVIVMSSILALIPVGAMAKPPVHPKANSPERIPVDLEQPFPSGPAGSGAKYSASKVLAHQATQDFVKKERPKFKLITFHPSFVLGGSLIQKTAGEIDGMNAMAWQSLQSKQPMIPSAFVHVRDIADAHIKAVENYQSIDNGMEYILAAPVLGWDNAAKLARDHYPQVKISLEQGPFPLDNWQVDTTPAEKDLGMKWRSAKETIGDLFDQQLALKKQSNL